MGLGNSRGRLVSSFCGYAFSTESSLGFQEAGEERERGDPSLPVVNFSLGVTAVTSAHRLLARAGNGAAPSGECRNECEWIE